MRHLQGIVLIGLLIALIGAYSVTAQTTPKPADAIATAQAALVTAQAALVTPTIAATATKAPTAVGLPTNTPRPAPTATARPTATSAPTATIAPTATPSSLCRIIRVCSTATATTEPRPTERPTAVPTAQPPVVPTAPPSTVLQTYKVLVIIPSVYIVDGQTLRVPVDEIQAARVAAESMPGWVRELSNGMGDVAVTVVVDAYPVSTFRQYCSGDNCGRWVGPTDIQRAITEQGGTDRYDIVATFVPDKINGVEIMTCPCGGIATTRYMSTQMYGTRISQTTVVHEFSHDVVDYWLLRRGYDKLPSCVTERTATHSVYCWGVANWTWFGGLLSGTLDPAITNGVGVQADGWRYSTMTQFAQATGEELAEGEFFWNGYEQPIAGHVDPEDHE